MFCAWRVSWHVVRSGVAVVFSIVVARNAVLECLDQHGGILLSGVEIFSALRRSAQELLKASVDDAKGPPIVASPNSWQDNVFCGPNEVLVPRLPLFHDASNSPGQVRALSTERAS